MIGVVSHLRRKIEGDAQPGDAMRQQIAVSSVGFRGRAETRILPHRPQPAAIHRRLDAARERKFAREAEGRVGIPTDKVSGERVGRDERGVVMSAANVGNCSAIVEGTCP